MTGVCLGIVLIVSSTAFAQVASTKDEQPAAAAERAVQANSAEDQRPQASQNDTSANQDKATGVWPKGHKYRLRLGGIAIGAGYSHFSGPFWPYAYPYGFYPPVAYSSLFWDPSWGGYPGFYPISYFQPGYGKGEVRLQADPKDAVVRIDGAYAGTADRLKTIWLDPGAYDLTISTADREPYEQRIYVLSGKSLKINAKLAVKKMPAEQEERR